jgi:raffinose/stachyose/melibiose transport system substrate-binding protein
LSSHVKEREEVEVMRRIVFVLLAMVLVFPVFATGKAEPAKGPIVLPFLQREGGNDANTVLTNEINRQFLEKYKGVYELKIENIPGMAEEYRQKLKTLASAGDLPLIVSEFAQEPAFGELLMANNRLLDLKPYFDKDTEWQKYVFTESVKYNTFKDGKMYTAPLTDDTFIGIYYNKEYFQKAGIKEFPKTWADFWVACDKLKAAGITPIALHTTETGWCTNLVLTTYLGATSPQGKEFMNIKYPTDQFNSPAYLDAVKMLKKLYQYTTSDAIGGKYALAANHFSNGDTAMIPNGPWMIASFSDTQYAAAGFEEKVGYARYPGDMMIGNNGLAYGKAVSLDKHSKEQLAGGVDYLRFEASPAIIKLRMIAVGSLTPKVQLSADEKAKMTPATREYVNAVEGLKQTIPWFQAQWDPITQNETVVKNLPAYLYGDMTAEQYCQSLVDSAKQYMASQQK